MVQGFCGMNIVPVHSATIDPRSVAGALADEFRAQGDELVLPALELLTAQVWLETGGRVTNNNFGNEMAAGFAKDGTERASWSGDAWRPPWFPEPTEATPTKYVTLHQRMRGTWPGNGYKIDVPSAFRSYPSPAAGLSNHVHVLRTNFPALVAAAASGDPEQFRLAVVTPDPKTKLRYSPDYGPSAVKTLTQLRDQFRAQKAFDGLAAAGGGAAGAVAVVLALGAAFAIWKLA